MSSRLAKLRAAGTALSVVLVVAFVVFLLIAAIALGVGFVWGSLFGGADVGDEFEATADFEATATDDVVTIQHEGGESFDGEQLYVEIGDEARGNWTELGGGDPVEDGDEIVVEEVEDGDTVTLRLMPEGETVYETTV